MDRRTFLKGSLVGAGMVAGLSKMGMPALAADTPAETPKAQLRLSSQQGLVPGRSLKEKIENLEKWGAAGIELGGEVGNPDNVKRIQDALAGSKIKVSAICAADGPYIVSDESQRRRAVENAKRILTGAGALGSTGVIMVPAFNGARGMLQNPEARKVLIDLLKEMGEHAVQAGSKMVLEPLNRGEAWYLRMLADAASICRDVNSPGIAMMGDFYHMHLEETSDKGAFISAGKYLAHVHMATRSRLRSLPYVDNSDYRDGFRGLKMIGYQNFVSLECGIPRGVDPKEGLPKTFDYLRKQWEEATV